MNKVNLVGRITTTPTVETVDMKPETRFTVALFRNPSDSRIDYVSCVAYDENAQFIEKNFQRGDNISIVGTIRTEKNEIRNRTIYSTRVLVEEVYYIRDPRTADKILDDYIKDIENCNPQNIIKGKSGSGAAQQSFCHRPLNLSKNSKND